MRKILFLLLVTIPFQLFAQEKVNPEEHKKHIREQIHMMTFAPAKHDDKGQLLPLQSYDETLDRSMAFIFDSLDTWFKGDPKTLYDEKGNKKPVYYYYANLAMDGQTFRGAPDNYVSYPAFHHAAYIQTFIDWYVYSGDKRARRQAIGLADWNIAHSTPTEYAYGGMPYSTFNKGKPGGFRDGAAIMPDKAAIMALAYLEVYQLTDEKRFYDAALLIAQKLAANQLPEGNWPFRVNPETKEVKEEYTSSIIYQIKLFEAIDHINKNNDFEKNKNAALNWLLNNPVKTVNWSGYYEDIKPGENRTNWDCIDVVRYLLEHQDENKNYMKIVRQLDAYLSDSIIKDGQSFTNVLHNYAPAEGIREQKACFVTMGVHSAHWAAMMMDIYLATGDKEYKNRALQTMNYVTYHLQPDGKILVGIDHEHEKYGWAFNQFWFSCHIATNIFLMEALATFPEFAPENENHLLSYTSPIQSIQYGDQKIEYTTTKASKDVLKISFTPSSVKLNGKELSGDNNGWRYDPETKLLVIDHKGGNIVIS